ncbi:hypothetical protein RFI_39831 [Reticulomyxa filosa]|uniref:Uncharacterized protein n=1 Tax=Reticulomyxa filosa TaxID=46433 RepID=X6LAD1_RETFI|nr:hypothetical protein RFI_39831 [Reticulomyxa filosa]|eukprot:ETN97694.1 hypothetical protein RFI_39831 [Reticulomyxa filosa]
MPHFGHMFMFMLVLCCNGDSVLALAVKNSEPNCASRLKLLNQYVPSDALEHMKVNFVFTKCHPSLQKKKKKTKQKKKFEFWIVCLSIINFFFFFFFFAKLQSLPLLYACQYRDDLNENLLRWLIPKHLEHNPDFWLNRHPKSGNYLLHLAVQNSHPNCLERLHLLKKIIPDHFYKQLLVLTNKNHQTALMYACAISSEVLGEGIFEILLPQLLDKASLSFWEMRDTVD